MKRIELNKGCVALEGTELEDQIGYCQAKRIGNIIAVTGASPIAEHGGIYAPGDVYWQARRCLEIVSNSLEALGASLEDVIRTRIFLKDMSQWKEAASAHEECFRSIRPATTFAEVMRFIHPDWLVKIEADAVLEE